MPLLLASGSGPDGYRLGDTLLDAVYSGDELLWTVPRPAITGVSPTGGPTAGGTTVTLTGINFSVPATVTFGGTPATNVVVAAADRITCIAPAKAAGVADVVVQTPYGSSAPFTYTYLGTAVYREEFNSGDGNGWGPNFTMLSGTGRINAGAATVNTISSGVTNNYAVYGQQPLRDDVFARARVITPPPYSQALDNEIILYLRANGQWENGTAGCVAIYPGSYTFATTNGSVYTERMKGGAIATGTVVRLQVRGNVWEFWDETANTRLFQWIDTDNAAPGGPGQRRMIMYQETNHTGFFGRQYASYAADWLEFGDLELSLPPAITAISPASMPSFGGVLTITGTHFYGRPTVRLDGAAVSGATVQQVSDTQVAVTFPALSPGTRTLELVFAHGTASRTLPIHFEDNRKSVSMSRPASPTFGIGGAPATVTGFSPASSHPDTVMSNNFELPVRGTGVYNLSGNATVNNGSVTITLRRNDAEVLATATSSGSGTLSFNVPNIRLVDGDRLSFSAVKDSNLVRSLSTASLTLTKV